LGQVAAELVVEVQGRAVNVDEILARVETEARQTDAAAQQLAATFSSQLASAGQAGAASIQQVVEALRTASAAAGLDESQFLTLAGALSQEALAAGNAAQADQILEQALLSESQRAQQATSAITQLSQAQQQQSQSAGLGASYGNAFAGSLTSIIGPAAAAGAAIQLVRSAIGQAEEGFKLQASFDQAHASLAILLNGVRDSGAVWAGAAAFADRYKLTQQEVTEAVQASSRVIRQTKAPIEDVLGAFARLKVLAPEKSFQDAARALGELQAGQTGSLNKMFNVPLAYAHKMKQEIDGGADAVVVLNKYLDTTGVTMGALDAQTKGATGKLKEMAQASERLQLALSGGSGGPGLALIDEKIAITTGLTRVLSADTAQMGQSIVQAGQQGSTSFQGLISALGPLGPLISQATGYAGAHADALRADAAAAQAQATAAAEASQGINLQSSAMIQAAAAAEAARQAAADHAIAVQDSAQASAADSIAKNEQASVTELLTLQTNNTVSAFLDLNPNLSASAAAAAAAAAGYAPEIAKLIEMAARARDARGEIAALNAQAGIASRTQQDFRAGERSGGEFNTAADQARAAGARQAQLRITQEATDAEDKYNRQIGNFGPVRARIESELALARARGDKAAEFNALTQLDQLDDKVAKAHKARGGAKLSDTQKLDNSLLAQQDKTNNQAEDAALKHEKKIEAIEQAAYQKRLDAEKAFNQDELDANASFYEQLGSVGSSGNAKIDQQLRKELSARRENAVLEAQKLGGDQGDAFLKASEAAISKEGQIQDKINKAKQEKNGGEAEYQAGILALQKKADDARLESIRTGGSQIENERKKQLADEDSAYQEQTGKIQTAAERARDAKILAAERSGKAIDVENLKLGKQADLLDRIGGAAGGRTTTPLGTPTTAGAAPPAALGGATVAGPSGPLDLSALLSKLDELKDAVVAAERQGAQQVTSAVRGAQASGGVAG